MVAKAKIFCFTSWDILEGDLQIVKYIAMKCWGDTPPYLAKVFPYLARKGSYKSRNPMLCQWGYRVFVQVLAICSKQVLAGRRINSEGLAFASNAILRQNTSDHAVSRHCLPFPLNNSNFWKAIIIPLGILKGILKQPFHNFMLKPQRRETCLK